MKIFEQFIVVAILLTTNTLLAQCRYNYSPGDDTIKIDIINHKPEHELNMLYVSLYDGLSLDEKKRQTVERRLNGFSSIIKRETLGKLQINPISCFIDVSELGDDSLNYSYRKWSEWVDDINAYVKNKYQYDILVFSPLKNVPWANDAHSTGFYKDNKICVALEFAPYSRKGFFASSYLLMHKILHGFGYHHQDEEYHQLYLLAWNLGMPNVWQIDQLKEQQNIQILYFNPHILKVLNLVKNQKNIGHSLDSNGLIAIEDTNSKRSYAQVSWDATGMDYDMDGILDSEDDYFLSSPQKGIDTDNDGIIDRLDLCGFNNIKIEGNIDIGKINLIAKENESTINFSGDSIDVFKIKVLDFTPIYPTKKPKGFGYYFADNDSFTVKGNSVSLKSSHNIKQIKVFYRHNSNEYYRSYYYYPKDRKVLCIVNNREWYYFNRFGCDAPATIDYYEVDTYDADGNGFVDENSKYSFGQLPSEYDWDNDGFPDNVDALPTVKGKYSNKYVSGVKDSDGDGMADPGQFDFKNIPIPKEYFFGEILKTLGDNPDYDRSPYFSGKSSDLGCPNQDYDNVDWYFDLHPFSTDVPLPKMNKNKENI